MFTNATRLARPLVIAGLIWAGCGSDNTPAGNPDAGPASPDAAASTADAGPDTPDAAPVSGVCAATGAGLDCLMALYDRARTGCDADDLDDLRESFNRRRGTFPVWHAGRALFLSDDRSVAVAGAFNDWVDGALTTARVCDTNMYVADANIATGHYPYKIVDAGTWSLDPMTWAFAYDEFAGNPDGRNSVLNTYDSGRGHLVMPSDELCSTDLGNCRPLTTYLPPGYQAPQNATRSYPVVFMHDGQNIFDDKDCCFGHTGWEINVAMDAEIAAGRVSPALVVGFDHGGAARTDEYGTPDAQGGKRNTFMAFQVDVVQPTAATYWRLDASRYYVAGSSMGGLISFYLAFANPNVYAGAASLSGSFWFGEEAGSSFTDTVNAEGKVPVALYLDHGGTTTEGGDNYQVNVDMAALLAQKGWQRSDAPTCTATQDQLCYHHDVGAVHNELAWRDRAHLFLRYFLAP